MKRLFAFIAAVAILAVAFVASSPAAYADRNPGWTYRGPCPIYESGYQLPNRYTESALDVNWIAGSNQRQVTETGAVIDGSGNFAGSLVNLGYWVKAVGGSWVNFYNIAYPANGNGPNSGTSYEISYTPGENPGQGHYFFARARFDNGNVCDTVTYLN